MPEPHAALPTIGIISPSFNQGAFIGAMLRSIQSQTLPPAEHIVLDGGSTDDSREQIRAYAERHSFVRGVFEPDNGQVDAINKGLESSSCEILTWLNTDDLYCDPEALRAVAEIFAAEPQTDVVYARGSFVDPDGNLLREAFVNRAPETFPETIKHSIGILQPALFFRREAIAKAGLLDARWNLSLDYELWIRFIKAGLRFRFLDRSIVKAVLHDASKTGGQRGKQYDEIERLVHEHFGFVPLRWLERHAEYLVEGKDGIVHSAGKDKDAAAIDREIDRLQREWNGSAEARAAIESCKDEPLVMQTLADLCRRGHLKARRVVVTSFTAAYFRQGLNLIASLNRHSSDSFDVLLVYAIDLSEAQRRQLGALDRVIVLDFPPQCGSFYPDYLAPKNYGYKCAAIWDAGHAVAEGGSVLWVDAGIAAVRSIEECFGIIERDGAFFVDHDDKPGWPFANSMFMHPDAARAMGATAQELLAPHLRSCMVGYTRGGSAQKMIDEAYAYSQCREVVVHSKHPPESERRQWSDLTPEQRSEFTAWMADRAKCPASLRAEQIIAMTPYWGHRQDQSIYSILCARYGILQHSAKRFCWSDDASSQASLANWQCGAEAQLQRSRHLPENMPLSTLAYHHRGLYDHLQDLPWKRSSQTLVVLGNGPSLKGFDFDSIRGFDTIGMNAAYRFWDRTGWYPTFYACMDTVVIRSHAKEIDRLIRERRRNGIRLFFLRREILTDCPHLEHEPTVVFFEDVRAASELLDTGMITTGSLSALFAGFLGYRRVALLGIDCNYVEKLPQAESAGGHQLVISDTPASNPNYFFDDYQQKGDLYNIPNVHPGFHERSWKAAHAALERAGVELVNCNPESKLDTVPRMPLHEALQPVAAPLPPALLGADYGRDAGAHIEELDFVGQVLGTSHADDVMIDVGTHRGTSLKPFLDRGWRVVGFEPSPTNRRLLAETVGPHPRLTLDHRALSNAPANDLPLYSTSESTAASSLRPFTDGHKEEARVEVTTLAIALREHKIDRVRLLKIDTEGYDMLVLGGFPWESLRPDAIVVEFEDRKTIPLGYSTSDLADALLEHGYFVYCSEWHPIVRYGVRHHWRRMFRWESEHPDPVSWGNLVAFRYRADAVAFETRIREAIRTGECTGVERQPQPRAVSAQASPAHEPQAAPPHREPSAYVRKIRDVEQRARHASTTKPAPLPGWPLVFGALPWAPRHSGPVSAVRHLMLSVGKLGRVYAGRAGVLAMGTVACWGAGVASLANGQPLWVGLALAGVSFVPLFTLIGHIAITARRQSFENCEMLRFATERAIRAAAEHQRGQQDAATSYTNALLAQAASLLEAQEDRRFNSRMDLQRQIDRNKSDGAKQVVGLSEQIKSLRKSTDATAAKHEASRAAAKAAADEAMQQARLAHSQAREAMSRADAAKADAGSSLRAQEGTVKAMGELTREATAGMRKATEVAQKATDQASATRQATEKALAEQLARIEQASAMLSRVRGDAYTQFSRVLSPAAEQHAAELGFRLKPGEFRYMERKLQVIEGLCEGRLAGSVDDAVARTLAARTWTGRELRILEIGVLFGVGAIFMHQALRPFYERVQLTLLDPFDGYYGPSHLDPLTGQRVNRAMLERNLMRCTIPSEDVTIIDKFSTDDEALAMASEEAPYAVVIVDGDHSREGVQADFERYAGMVAPGGVLIVDDYGSKDWPAVTAYTREVIEVDPRFRQVAVLGKTAVFRRLIEQPVPTIESKPEPKSVKAERKSAEKRKTQHPAPDAPDGGLPFAQGHSA